MLAAMESRQVGMPLIPSQLFMRSLAGMKYFAKSGEGMGEMWYRHRKEYPIYGTEKGSCVSPVVWILISVVLINALQALHHGMTFHTPDGTVTTSHPIDSLVDDTTIGSNTPREMIHV